LRRSPAALAAVLSFLVARSIVRPYAGSRMRATPRGRRDPTPLPEEGARELASLAQAFNEMALQLETSRDSERNFLLSVSHELKTPLTAIRATPKGSPRVPSRPTRPRRRSSSRRVG